MALRHEVGRAAARMGERVPAADRALGHADRRARSGCWASTRRAACRSPTASTRPSSSAGRSTGWSTGGGTSSRRRRAGHRAPRPARSPTRTPTWPSFEDDAPVLLFVGRFTEVKRVGLLIEASRAPASASRRAPRSSCSAASRASGRASTRSTRSAASGRRTSSSPAGTSTRSCPTSSRPSDAVVLPTVREQFGQVLVEGMACGLPALAVDALGPSDIVDDGDTGWLVPPDDGTALEDGPGRGVVNDRDERRRRGRNALRGGPRALRLAVAGAAGRGRLRGAARKTVASSASGPGERPSGRIKPPFGPMTAGSQLATVPARQCPFHALREQPVAATPATDSAGRPVRPRIRARRMRRRVRRAARRRAQPRDGPARDHGAGEPGAPRAPPAPTPTPATARGCCCRCPTS